MPEHAPRESLWTIERLVPGGDGLARLADGRIGFASGALPGDRILPRRVDDRRGFVRALDWELVEPGPNRVEPPCPVVDECGGCGVMRLARPIQLSEKIGILRQALERIGGFRELPSEIRIVSAGSDVGYRTRIRLHIDKGALGFYARGTHRLVEIPACVVAADDVNRALEKLRAVAARRPGSLAPFREVEIRAAPSQPTSVRFVPRADVDTSADATRALFDELGQDLLVSIASHGVDPEQRFELPDGVELTVPASAFVQVNQAVNRALVEAVVAGAKSRKLTSFCDVFCGAGNFTLPLAAAGLAGVGVDRASSGIAAAEQSARASKLSIELVRADARTTLQRFARERRRFDLVLLDPPRIGAKDLITQVTSLAARYVAMVSCDPPTFARDLRALRDGGFALEELALFDMFPHTPHVEALAWMASRGGK